MNCLLGARFALGRILTDLETYNMVGKKTPDEKSVSRHRSCIICYKDVSPKLCELLHEKIGEKIPEG